LRSPHTTLRSTAFHHDHHTTPPPRSTTTDFAPRSTYRILDCWILPGSCHYSSPPPPPLPALPFTTTISTTFLPFWIYHALVHVLRILPSGFRYRFYRSVLPPRSAVHYTAAVSYYTTWNFTVSPPLVYTTITTGSPAYTTTYSSTCIPVLDSFSWISKIVHYIVLPLVRFPYRIPTAGSTIFLHHRFTRYTATTCTFYHGSTTTTPPSTCYHYYTFYLVLFPTAGLPPHCTYHCTCCHLPLHRSATAPGSATTCTCCLHHFCLLLHLLRSGFCSHTWLPQVHLLPPPLVLPPPACHSATTYLQVLPFLHCYHLGSCVGSLLQLHAACTCTAMPAWFC